MTLEILNQIKRMKDAELAKLVNDIFILKDGGVWPADSDVRNLSRLLSNQTGIPLHNTIDLVTGEIFVEIARRFVTQQNTVKEI